jgi:hypothetical protein
MLFLFPCASKSIGQFGKPKAASAQSRRRKENLGVGIHGPERSVNPPHEGEVVRVVAEKPALHVRIAGNLSRKCRRSKQQTATGEIGFPSRFALQQNPVSRCRDGSGMVQSEPITRIDVLCQPKGRTVAISDLGRPDNQWLDTPDHLPIDIEYRAAA